MGRKDKESHKAVVLKAFVHCDGCSDKLSSCLKDFDGVNNVTIDRDNHKVIVKGEAVKDPMKILEMLQKKYSKNVELISPKPKPEQNKDAEKKEQPKIKTTVLKTFLHCEGCATDVKRIIRKMEGVTYVEVNNEKSQVIVKGTVEAAKLVECVKKKLRKHAEIVKEDNKKDGKEVIEDEKGDQCIVMFSYPPQYSTQHLYPSQIFSDENVFSCSIM